MQSFGLFLVFSHVMFSQTQVPPVVSWIKYFGREESNEGTRINEIIQTRDQNFLIAGETDDKGGYDNIYIVKVDSEGNTIAEFTTGSDRFDEWITSIIEMEDGSLLALVRIQSDTYLWKMSSKFDILWQKTLLLRDNNEHVFALLLHNDSLFLLGSIRVGTPQNPQDDILLVKTDIEGNVIWEERYGGNNTDRGFSLIKSTDEDIVITGYTYSMGPGDRNAYLLKVSSLDGELRWERAFGRKGYSADGYSALETEEKNFIFVGDLNRWDERKIFYPAQYVVTVDQGGAIVWEKINDRLKDLTVGGGLATGYSIREASDSGFLIVGEAWDRTIKFLVRKITPSGDEQWGLVFGQPMLRDHAYFIREVVGGYIVIGNSERRIDKYDIAMIKLCTEKLSTGIFRRGDVNFTCSVDLTDAINILEHLFLGKGFLSCLDAADTDDNGLLNITDAIYILSHLFLGGPPMPQPFPSAGRDLTTDSLDCRNS